jgi:hypothetical protein
LGLAVSEEGFESSHVNLRALKPLGTPAIHQTELTFSSASCCGLAREVEAVVLAMNAKIQKPMRRILMHFRNSEIKQFATGEDYSDGNLSDGYTFTNQWICCVRWWKNSLIRPVLAECQKTGLKLFFRRRALAKAAFNRVHLGVYLPAA